MIQAIETRYKGYRFHSRLEARWAVFFDAMGIEWAYEHEGYKLPSGYYLPDFWLPKLNLHAEVKPQAPSEHEWQLCKELALSTFGNVVVLDGLPSTLNYWGWMCFEHDPVWPERDEQTGKWKPYITECDWVFCSAVSSKGLQCTGVEFPNREDFGHHVEHNNHQQWPALQACRAARFEHGETPQIYIEPKYPLTGKPDEEFLRLCDAARFADPHEFDQLPKSKPAN